MTFIAGRYAAQYGGVSLGQAAEGWDTEHKEFTREVRGDAGGETVQDEIYRGLEVMLNGKLIEFDAAAAQSAFWPWSATWLDMGVIGRLKKSMAKPIILTAVQGTNAVPASLTFPLCCLAAGFPVKLLYAPDLREVPLRFRVFAGDVTSQGNGLNSFGSKV